MKILRIIGLSALLVITAGNIAQADSFSPNTDNSYQNNSRNPNGILGTDVDPVQLFNKIMLAPGRSSDEFNSDSQKNLNSAAEQFKKQQLQTISGGSQTNSNSQSSTP
jgi:hypothetical protein